MADPLINPYEGVNWGTVVEHPGVTHMHGLEDRWDEWYAQGTRIMAPSNYYPEQPVDRGTFTGMPGDTILIDNSEQHGCTDSNLHYCPVGSNQAHDGGTGLPWQTAFDEALSMLDYPDGGGITINHPAFSNLSALALRQFLDHDPKVLGIEVYNHMCVTYYTDYRADSAFPHWDAALASGRRCWGFFTHDHYIAELAPYLGFNMLLIDGTVTEEKALLAYREGQFYGAMHPTGLRCTGLTVADHEVTVTTDSADTLTMVTDLGTVSEAGPSHTFTVPLAAVYARFEGTNEATTIYTQPLMYEVATPEPLPSPISAEAAARAAQRRRFMLM